MKQKHLFVYSFSFFTLSSGNKSFCFFNDWF